MAITPARPEELAEAQRALRAEIRVPKAEPRNVAIAAEINADSYFMFGRTRYKVPPLGYKLGVQLQELQLTIENLAQTEQEEAARQALTEQDKLAHLALLSRCYEQAVNIFWQACHPAVWYKRWGHQRTNPFLGCTSQEIGELLGFFFMCRMKSRVSMQGSLASRPSLSISTPRTT